MVSGRRKWSAGDTELAFAERAVTAMRIALELKAAQPNRPGAAMDEMPYVDMPAVIWARLIPVIHALASDVGLEVNVAHEYHHKAGTVRVRFHRRSTG